MSYNNAIEAALTLWVVIMSIGVYKSNYNRKWIRYCDEIITE